MSDILPPVDFAPLDPSWVPEYASIISYWKLNGRYDDSMGNSQGYARNMLFSSISEHGILAGSCGQFNGKNSYVSARITTTQVSAITMSVWFRSNQYNQPGQLILYNGSDASANGYGLALNSENDRNGILRVLYGGIVWFDTRTYVTDHLWHHAALTIREDGRPELYLDGVSTFTFQGMPRFPNMPTSVTEIGRNDYRAARYFNGSIAQAAIFRINLTAEGIRNIYERQFPTHRVVNTALSALVGKTSSTTSKNEVKNDEDSMCPEFHHFTSLWTPAWQDLRAVWELRLDARDWNGENDGIMHNINIDHRDDRLRFNGTSSYVSAPLVAPKVSQVTLSAWFETKDYTQPGQTIIYVGSDRSGNGYGIALNNEGDHDGTLRVLYGGIKWFNTGVLVRDKFWHHAVLVISSDGRPRLYLDGSLVFLGEAGVFPHPPTAYVEIGRNDYPAHRYFKGKIAGVAIWTSQLSEENVLKLYQGQVPNHERALVASRISTAKTNPSRCGHFLHRLGRHHPSQCRVCEKYIHSTLRGCVECRYDECENCYFQVGKQELPPPWVPFVRVSTCREATVATLLEGTVIERLSKRSPLRWLPIEILKLLAQFLPGQHVRIGIRNRWRHPNGQTAGIYDQLCWVTLRRLRFEEDFARAMTENVFGNRQQTRMFWILCDNGDSLEHRLRTAYRRPKVNTNLELAPDIFNCLGALVNDGEILNILEHE